MKLMKCPACGAPITGQVTGRVMVCEYCDSKFVLDQDMADAVAESDEVDEYEEYYGQWESIAEFAQAACEDFLDEVGYDCFNMSKRIYHGLGIDEEEDVYLIHDDSMLGRGKNGFAITDSGLVCRDMGDPMVQLLEWPAFAEYSQPYIEEPYIMADGVKLCYYTDDSDLMPHLLGLYESLHEAAQYLAYWDEEPEEE